MKTETELQELLIAAVRRGDMEKAKELADELEYEMQSSEPDDSYVDNMVYGDFAHEAYLRSEQYEEDCRSEQWDWLKNEMQP